MRPSRDAGRGGEFLLPSNAKLELIAQSKRQHDLHRHH
jgi:hypothetical protein